MTWNDLSPGPRARARGYKVAEWTAARGWTTPRRLARVPVNHADMAYLAGGELLVLYSPTPGNGRTSVRASVWSSNGGRSDDVVLATYHEGEDVSALQVSADARGGAVAVWTVYGNSEVGVATRAAIRRAHRALATDRDADRTAPISALAVAANDATAVFGQSHREACSARANAPTGLDLPTSADRDLSDGTLYWGSPGMAGATWSIG